MKEEKGESPESSLIEFGEFFSLGFKVTEMVMDKKKKKKKPYLQLSYLTCLLKPLSSHLMEHI